LPPDINATTFSPGILLMVRVPVVGRLKGKKFLDAQEIVETQCRASRGRSISRSARLERTEQSFAEVVDIPARLHSRHELSSVMDACISHKLRSRELAPR